MIKRYSNITLSEDNLLLKIGFIYEGENFKILFEKKKRN